MKSTRPFHETLQALLEVEGISQRQLTQRVNRKGYSAAHATLNRIYSGRGPAHPEHIEAIARALNIVPEVFAEYRLWRARSRYDPSEIGWNKAIKNLQRLEADEGDALSSELPADGDRGPSARAAVQRAERRRRSTPRGHAASG